MKETRNDLAFILNLELKQAVSEGRLNEVCMLYHTTSVPGEDGYIYLTKPCNQRYRKGTPVYCEHYTNKTCPYISIEEEMLRVRCNG
jgi:hypothetical protein